MWHHLWLVEIVRRQQFGMLDKYCPVGASDQHKACGTCERIWECVTADLFRVDTNKSHRLQTLVMAVLRCSSVHFGRCGCCRQSPRRQFDNCVLLHDRRSRWWELLKFDSKFIYQSKLFDLKILTNCNDEAYRQKNSKNVFQSHLDDSLLIKPSEKIENLTGFNNCRRVNGEIPSTGYELRHSTTKRKENKEE